MKKFLITLLFALVSCLVAFYLACQLITFQGTLAVDGIFAWKTHVFVFFLLPIVSFGFLGLIPTLLWVLSYFAKQNRVFWGYARGAAAVSLLATLLGYLAACGYLLHEELQFIRQQVPLRVASQGEMLHDASYTKVDKVHSVVERQWPNESTTLHLGTNKQGELLMWSMD